ncbi:heme-binding protein [Sphingomonas sp. LHG3406-1]|uniref:SOUL family heme-binding protein n=1 Tax=Sphingomonas sp. LHG3406-1 TaxID=2804617 RepID=UPI002635C036|nr:heme-binding protein [Sphingomonas sp. LHG3406-1]
MKLNWKATGTIAASALVGLGIAYVLREKAAPRPNWRVLVSDGDLQIRSYPAVRVAETIIAGPRKEALNNGYRLLSSYVLGEDLPMTVPVLQDAGNPMASDPPLFDDEVEGAWRVRFILPDDATDLDPPPEGITLVEIPARRMGAATFHGTAHDDRLQAAADRLRGWLSRHGEECLASEPEYAFFNSPMIPPPLRRNEVLLALK